MKHRRKSSKRRSIKRIKSRLRKQRKTSKRINRYSTSRGGIRL